MQATVQTKEQARKIINNWINDNIGKNLNATNYIEHGEGHCACGQTETLMSWFEDGDMISVPICPNCGEDLQ